VPLSDFPLENLEEDLDDCLCHVSFVSAFAILCFVCSFNYDIYIYVCIFPFMVLIDFLFPMRLHYL
jgi:hypothetical protein